MLTMSCAERQEEAEKLGQEVMEQDSLATDTTAATAAVEPDSSATKKAAADALAALKETTALAPAPSGEGYTVQVAACESYDYAQHLLDLYRRRGYEPYAVQIDHEGQAFYRVRIGSFETAAEAAALKSELSDKYSTETWVDWKSN